MLVGLALAAGVALAPKPNVVFIFVDDMGYGDPSCYGNRAYRTPNIDRLAAEGVRFTDFYVASPACSPSRAALLTGCYPVRIGVPQVLNPDSKTRLNPSENTIPKTLAAAGYATAGVGKWHLGVNNLNPLAFGFQTFYGLPYSNDMWPPNGKQWPRLFLQRDGKPIEEIKTLDDQALLTGKYTRFAQKFIADHRKSPFFLYLAHSMPHVPLAASPAFRGRSKAGLYGDVIQEIDWSVGEIVKTLRANHLERNTLVFFSSDNGPWRPYGDHAGSTGGLREGKGTTFEAGMREPGIFWWPGRIPAGRVVREMATTMDLLPTIARLAGTRLPDRKIDGYDIHDLLTGAKGAKTPYKWFYYYWPGELQAVRSGDWKLHVPHSHRHQTEPAGRDGKPAGEVTEKIGVALFNLATDPGETKNLADQRPEIVARLMKMIEVGRSELGDTLTKTTGTGVRPPGQVVGR